MKCTIGFSVTFENCVKGFYVQAPGVDYPAHAHDAEEWYLILRLLETNRLHVFNYINLKGCAKGQLISKCLFGVFTFFQKTNENKSTSSKVEFVRSFFGRNVGLKQSFRICLTFSV